MHSFLRNPCPHHICRASLATKTSPIKMITYNFEVLDAVHLRVQMTIWSWYAHPSQERRRVRKAPTDSQRLPSASRVMVVLMIFGYVSSFVNWAFCTVVTPILAMRNGKECKGLHFSYDESLPVTTMILGRCLGPSASLYALVTSEGPLPHQTKIGVLTQIRRPIIL